MINKLMVEDFMKHAVYAYAIALSILWTNLPAIAWNIDVENKTERILDVQGEMVAVISERRATDWKIIKPGEKVTFETGARAVKGLRVRFPIDEASKKYNYPILQGALLEESKSVGMAINPHYKITYVATPDDKGGSTETFFLMRMPNIPLSRPGGIVAESKPVYFGPHVSVPGVLDNKQAFKRWEGSDDTPYDQAYYVMAHNSYSSTKYGFTIDPQQDISITDLLKYGLRGINLDTWLYKDGIYLIHGNVKETKLLLKPLQEPDPLKIRLDEIIKFLRTYPRVVITMTLEDYVGKQVAKFDELLKPNEDLIFTPSDFEALNNTWPTLGWMRSKNKRLIILKNPPHEKPEIITIKKDNQEIQVERTGGESKYIFDNEWKYQIENQYSKTDKKELARERDESKQFDDTKRTLYIMNYFAEFNPARDFPIIKKEVYKSSLEDAVDYVLKNGLEGKFIGQKPNFIMVDFAEWSDALDIVHDWNQPRPRKTQPLEHA